MSPRSGREPKAWGEAQRNPRNQSFKLSIARGAGGSPEVPRLSTASRAAEIFRTLTWGSLRFTPGFTLPTAPRAHVLFLQKCNQLFAGW